jgi:hypothetical protein
LAVRSARSRFVGELSQFPPHCKKPKSRSY